MNIKELREIIADLPGEMPVVVLSEKFDLPDDENEVIELGEGHIFYPWELKNAFTLKEKYVGEDGKQKAETTYLSLAY